MNLLVGNNFEGNSRLNNLPEMNKILEVNLETMYKGWFDDNSCRYFVDNQNNQLDNGVDSVIKPQ